MRNLVVVVVNPKFSENVGAIARACANFGVSELVVVSPVNFDWERAKVTATRVGEEVLNSMRVVDDIKEALSGADFVVGTTARVGQHRKVFYTLRDAVERIREELLVNKVALVFGNERYGLSNEELSLCQMVLTIPTHGGSSLNLSHAVAVVLYEIYAFGGKKPSLAKVPKRASFKEQEVMYSLIRDVCKVVGYVPHDNEALWMSNIRQALSKIPLSSREVRMVIGFCKAVMKKISGGSDGGVQSEDG